MQGKVSLFSQIRLFLNQNKIYIGEINSNDKKSGNPMISRSPPIVDK